MSEAFRGAGDNDNDNDGDLDFSRYAPEPRLVWNNPGPPTPDELAQMRKLIRSCLGLAWVCVWASGVIIRRRLQRWFDEHIVQSLFSAWLAAGLGWGFFLVNSGFTIFILAR